MYHIYGKPSCIFCIKAKNLLEREGIEYGYVDITQDKDAEKYIIEDLKARSVPQIFHNNVHIGGYDDLLVALSDA